MSTIIAIFLALGIGILIGGTLGPKWVVQTENRIVDILMTRYENQLSMNQLLQKQVTSLQLMNQTTDPILHNQRIMWIHPSDEKNELLAFVMKSAGAQWMDHDLESMPTALDMMNDPLGSPDIILVSWPEEENPLREQLKTFRNSNYYESHAKVVDVNAKALNFTEPQEAVDFIHYLKNIMEEDSYASFGIYRYPSLE